MARLTADEARSEILEAARRRFAVAGFRGTSLADIASEGGRSKASILYHFASKEDILAELVEPLWSEMEALAAELVVLPDVAAQELALSRMPQIALTHRASLAIFYGEIPELLQMTRFSGTKAASDQILAALVRRSSRTTDSILARIVVAGVAAACHEYQEALEADLSAAIHFAMRVTLAPALEDSDSRKEDQ